ncbi:MAG: sigma-54-dependent Fis family transcriptional regulator [Bryobacteraceae bacterium]|nr:sigma-54-dependent Fis family transcriptional regulator [Bryobacteraceae bacterium]
MDSSASKDFCLSRALSLLVPGVSVSKTMVENLAASFEGAAEGLGAGKSALFLLKRTLASIRPVGISSVGYTPQQVKAAATGRISDGTGLSYAWDVLTGFERNRQPAQLHQNSRVLCVAVSNPVLDSIAAIAIFGRDESQPAFDEQERMWADLYALAAGHAIARGIEGTVEVCTEPFEVEEITHAPKLIGESLWSQNLRRELHQIYIPSCGVRDPDPILILGDKGTGKDLIARYINAYSARRNKPFIAVNCAEITDELASSRFFGHRKGSFTGSVGNEPGFFRAAHGGVLFLDEIAELSLRAQGTLLRVLENRTIVPLGETKESRVDVQVILATNRDPARAVAEGILRADLCDRFQIQAIYLQPLRERPSDIPLLVNHFVAYHEERMGKKVMGIDPEALKAMVGYSWPGNIRELGRVCSLLVAHATPNSSIGLNLLSRQLPGVVNSEWNPKAGALLLGNISMRDGLRIFEREMILSRLRQFNWDIRATRKSLGLPKTTFHRHLRELKLTSVMSGPPRPKELPGREDQVLSRQAV